MRKIESALLILLFFTMLSCSSDKEILDSPALRLIITKADDGTPVANGVVLLYSNYDSWYETENPVASTITNENGEAVFYNLKEQLYYFDAYCKNYWNYPKGIYRVSEPLSMGIKTTVKVSLYLSDFDINE